MPTDTLPGMDEPGTIFSPCKRYRYRLARRWAPVGDDRLLRWILMNPSKATAFDLDNTLKNVAQFTRAWGYFGFVVCNLKAYISPYPAILTALADDAIGVDNDRYILEEAASAPLIICAWGAHPSFQARALQVMEMLAPYAAKLRCLMKTAEGYPRHPLYTDLSLPMQPFP